MAFGKGQKNLTAGMTGHQQIGSPEVVDWVRRSLAAVIERFDIGRGLTSLAIGADQLFASILLSKNIPYTAIIPSKKYHETFDEPDLQDYKKLLAAAEKVEFLDFPEPGENAYLAAGQTIVQRADVLIAVWNGKPAQGMGGTGDIVSYAKSQRKTIVHINPLTREVLEISTKE